jgi:hypothetical protein
VRVVVGRRADSDRIALPAGIGGAPLLPESDDGGNRFAIAAGDGKEGAVLGLPADGLRRLTVAEHEYGLPLLGVHLPDRGREGGDSLFPEGLGGAG